MMFVVDSQYQISLLERDLAGLEKQIPVYEQGILQEEANQDLQIQHLKALYEARNNLRKNASIVLLTEYRNIINEIGFLDQNIAYKNNIINGLKETLKQKRVAIETTKENIRKITIQSRRGVVLPFAKRTT